MPSTARWPLVGVLDEERMANVQVAALQAVERHRSRWLILDITGVPLINQEVASGLFQVNFALRLLGCTMILVGLSPAAAQALVTIEVNTSGMITCSTVEDGLGYAQATTARVRSRA